MFTPTSSPRQNERFFDIDFDDDIEEPKYPIRSEWE